MKNKKLNSEEIENLSINKKEDIERRNFNLSEIRVDEQETRKVVGYASVFNSLSENLGGFREQIDKRAFDSVLEDTKNLDCRCLFNHDPNFILARSPKTLRLSVDDNGLRYEFDSPETSFGNDLLVSLQRGDISQSSFGFVVETDEWTQNEDGSIIRTIKKVSRLLDVSPVTYPAYTSATVAQRSFNNFKLELEKEENKKQQKDFKKRNLLEHKLKLINHKKK